MKTIKILAISAIALTVVSCNKQGVTNKPLKTEIDSVSYALGLDMANKIKANFKEVDSDLFLQGYKNGIDSTNLKIETKDLNKIIGNYFQKKQQEMAKKKQEEDAKKFADNKKAGEDFLAKNKTKKGVITTKSGLQYIVLKKGTGKSPKPTSKVTLHYHGTTIDGKVFDSSVERKQPITHSASGFVPGFNEAIALMKEGGKLKVFIPQELAYGVQQRGDKIKPYSALVFEIELLKVED